MAHIQVEASVRTHHKFLKAGPAASWLWLCGMGYCQDGLTDGFIPESALPYLGVQKPHPLKDKLVDVGLWDRAEGGWLVHDYLKHNRSAAQIGTLKDRRRAGGNLGGRPPKEPSEKPSRLTIEGNHTENPSHLISSQIHLNDSNISAHQGPPAKPALRIDPLDGAFFAFQSKYPQARRKGGLLVEQSFVTQVARAGGVNVLMEALDNHLASEQWLSGKVPGMDIWLNEERWRQTLEPPVEKPAGVFAGWKPRS